MLIQSIKEQLKQAIKSQNEVEKDVLRVLLGEVSTIENSSSQNGPVTDQQVIKVIKKIVMSNNETIGYLTEGDTRKSKLIQENVVLETFLPQQLSLVQVKNELADIVDQIKSVKGGAAVGVAMKHLRSKQLSVDGNDVKCVVEEIQNGV